MVGYRQHLCKQIAITQLLQIDVSVNLRATTYHSTIKLWGKKIVAKA